MIVMKSGEKVRNMIYEVIQNQLDANDPPETKINFERLKSMGYSEFEARQHVAQCFAVELFDMMKYHKPYNRSRYIRNLNQLPKEPFD